jgi:hypothetical protein
LLSRFGIKFVGGITEYNVPIAYSLHGTAKGHDKFACKLTVEKIDEIPCFQANNYGFNYSLPHPLSTEYVTVQDLL